MTERIYLYINPVPDAYLLFSEEPTYVNIVGYERKHTQFVPITTH